MTILALAGVAFAAIISVTYFADRNGGSSLPAGCVKPANGFVIIASDTGFNDSIGHGAPEKSWPIITVHQGEAVTIVVCNTDRQAHGFQIAHYFDSSIQTVEPGQVLKVPFVANQAGTFQIYCSIFCTIHVYMQSGLLNVTAS
ncbi:MAG TPA: hypothetical protein VGS04_04080 [Nitrososphaerales archaeon]|nr:hypothetical protein [Nitrososphaerales archaeon]